MTFARKIGSFSLELFEHYLSLFMTFLAVNLLLMLNDVCRRLFSYPRWSICLFSHRGLGVDNVDFSAYLLMLLLESKAAPSCLSVTCSSTAEILTSVSYTFLFWLMFIYLCCIMLSLFLSIYHNKFKRKKEKQPKRRLLLIYLLCVIRYHLHVIPFPGLVVAADIFPLNSSTIMLTYTFSRFGCCCCWYVSFKTIMLTLEYLLHFLQAKDAFLRWISTMYGSSVVLGLKSTSSTSSLWWLCYSFLYQNYLLVQRISFCFIIIHIFLLSSSSTTVQVINSCKIGSFVLACVSLGKVLERKNMWRQLLLIHKRWFLEAFIDNGFMSS